MKSTGAQAPWGFESLALRQSNQEVADHGVTAFQPAKRVARKCSLKQFTSAGIRMRRGCLKTAKALGLTMPQIRADKIIQ